METYTSAQSPFQKLNLGHICPKIRNNRYQNFVELSSFTEFFIFVPNILSKIAWKKKFLVLTRPSLLQTFFFWDFVYPQRISPIFMENIKRSSCVKLPGLMVLCKQYFAYLVSVKIDSRKLSIWLIASSSRKLAFLKKLELFPGSLIIIGSAESKKKLFKQYCSYYFGTLQCFSGDQINHR